MVQISSNETAYNFTISESSGIGEARRNAAALSLQLNFSATLVGRVSLVVTEVASNLVKHAQGGELLIRALAKGSLQGVQILALDKGPGIRNIGDSLRDGYSSTGSAGTGLGAIRRLSDHFDIYSVGGLGTAVLSEVWSAGTGEGARAPFQMGVVSTPFPGEDVCGDGWAVRMQGDCCRMIIADGLGHGPGAADAAREAVDAFSRATTDSPEVILQSIHGALRKTRGAAVAIAELERSKHSVEYAGIGNISGLVFTPERRQNLVSHNGTLGQQAHRTKSFTYGFEDDALIVMHSDGLSTHWSLTGYPGLMERHPALIAGVLYRDFRRGRDDVTVLVVK